MGWLSDYPDFAGHDPILHSMAALMGRPERLLLWVLCI